jgi:hypothetical protein
MNQTKKRLSIINLAISITDIETIQLQILKLGLLHTDIKIQEILKTLQNNNYAQAQALITHYIDTPNKEILQRTFQEERAKNSAKDQAIIEEFNLFTTEKETSQTKQEVHTLDLDEMLAFEESEETIMVANEKEKTVPNEETISTQTLDLDDMLTLEAEGREDHSQTIHETVDFDTLLNVKHDEILSDNIEIDISHKADNQANDFWNDDIGTSSFTENIPKDTFFDKAVEDEEIQISSRPVEDEHLSPEPVTEVIAPAIEDLEDPIIEEVEQVNDSSSSSESDTENISPDTSKEETVSSDPVHYRAIPYIDQKFKNMQVQYPANEAYNEKFTSVENWLIQISNQGYTEHDVEKVLNTIDEIRAENKAEAAQLLLISAATESKYAQFRLARTLYKGDILEKNLPEAFTLINRLAVNDDYLKPSVT